MIFFAAENRGLEKINVLLATIATASFFDEARGEKDIVESVYQSSNKAKIGLLIKINVAELSQDRRNLPSN